jgi:hypothetical protein
MGQKRPCQHLGLDFRQLSTLKKQHVSFLEKKMFYTKKVTRLPDLTLISAIGMLLKRFLEETN